MPESIGNNRRNFSKFDNMSTEKLEHILWADSQLADGVNSDTDAILYIMEVIAKRENELPTERFTDVHTAWASFSENYFPYTSDDKSLYDYEEMEEQTGIRQTPSTQPSQPLKKRRLARVACVVAAVIVLLLASTITASAFGFDLWGTVAKWTKDTFGFTVSSEKQSDTQFETNQGSYEYHDLQDALDHYDITAFLAPTKLPKGYAISNVDVIETPTKTKIVAIYSNDEDEIEVDISAMTEYTPSTFEKDDGVVIEYESGGIVHYIMTNNGWRTAAWAFDNYECAIIGVISETELTEMIDSIYEK